MESLSGSVERVTYYNPENGYSVIRLHPKGKKAPGRNRQGLVTVVGNLPELSPGEHLELRGNWEKHPKHGLQFKATHCENSIPSSTEGIRRYLGSSLIKGIGPKLAESIVDTFGEETLDVISEQPERLEDVYNIGGKRVRQIAEAWEAQKNIKDIMLFLHSHGISTTLATKIYKTYEDEALQVVQDNPYQLARDIYGVGFKTADKIARDLGLPEDHPARMEAGIIYALNQMTNEGHVYVPAERLVNMAAELLEAPQETIPPALARLEREKEVIRDQVSPRDPGEDTPVIYLPPFYASEIGTARKIRLLQAHPAPVRQTQLPQPDSLLTAEQQGAVEAALKHPVSVLTGGPGTGKTTTLHALIAALEQAQKTYALCSPTGRAAKRLSEATQRPASTIHRLLGYSPLEGFKYNRKHPLPVDFLIVDEASMLDIILANHLLNALEPGTHLLFVGDVDQLPSVGAGDVLRDVIASGTVPVTRLTTIFRQAQGSHIILNAHRVNQGKLPIFEKDSQDFFLFPAQEAEKAAHWVEDVTCQRIPDKFGLDPLHEVQVLAPMYRGLAGVDNLNVQLQARLNPKQPQAPEKALYGQVFRVGDKVMQTQNDYQKDVYNGDIGFVTGIDFADQALNVDFQGQRVRYDWTEGDQLVHAYAVSVHKAQGSEFPAVVIPILTQHYVMLQRNLIYTAITRAKSLCVLVGNRKALAIAVNNNQVAERFSALGWRLTLEKKKATL